MTSEQNPYKSKYKSKFWNLLFKVRENYFITACAQGDFAKMEYYLKNGVDVDTTAGYGYSALTFCTRDNKVCEFLLKWGASISDKMFIDVCASCTQREGFYVRTHTPEDVLRYIEDSEKTIALLLQYGANPDAKFHHISALSILARQNSPKAVETLLKHHPQNIGQALFHATPENMAIIAPYCTIEDLKHYIDNSDTCTVINSIYLAKTLDEEMPASEKKTTHKI